jgi:uncharacterized membrane protein (UPF0127 family)
MKSRRAFIAFAVAAAVGPRVAQAQYVTFQTDQFTVVTRSGPHDFQLKIANSRIKTAMGLRYQHSIPLDGGMLFSGSTASPTVMSVSTEGVGLNTDVVFVSLNGRIVDLYPWVQPNSPVGVTSRSPVVAALQLAGGTIMRIGAILGDKVVHPMFRNAG